LRAGFFASPSAPSAAADFFAARFGLAAGAALASAASA
jgi:hypothetical protein